MSAIETVAKRFIDGCIIKPCTQDLLNTLITKRATFTSELPLYSKCKTIEDLMQHVVQTKIRDIFPDLNIQIDDVLSKGNKVIVTYTVSGTFNGSVSYRGVEPNGKSFSARGVFIFNFQGEKISSLELISDELHRLLQVGVPLVDVSAIKTTIDKAVNMNKTGDFSNFEEIYNPDVELLYLVPGAKGPSLVKGVKDLREYYDLNAKLLINPQMQGLRLVHSLDGKCVTATRKQIVDNQTELELTSLWEFDDQARYKKMRVIGAIATEHGTA